jgi:hypothetical protein
MTRTAPNPTVTQDRRRVLVFGLGPGPEGVQCMGNENPDAQNNQECGNSFKHRRILRNRPLKDRLYCTVKKIRSSGLRFLIA